MIKTILFAADMGIHTSYLLHHVNSTALKYNARVVVLHVMESAPSVSGAFQSGYRSADAPQFSQCEGLTQIIEQVRSRIIDSLEDEFMDGHQGLSNICDVRVLPGRPAEVILSQATHCRADMIVLGSHGSDAVGENVLGSVASTVLKMTRVPVYMVPLVRNVMWCARAS